jgi:protein-S-isoprenylcysteine O-methyltransferase Ste14
MNIAEVQHVRKVVLGVAVLIGVVMFAVSSSVYSSGGMLHEIIERAGLAAIIVCILGRTWASLYIGGRKIEQFITNGPYSVARNPLYFFSILGAAGAGAQLGSVISAAVFGALAWVVFYIVVLQEERLLAQRYGEAYASYAATVPRFLPRPGLWHDAPTLVVMPPKMLRTFADATIFLLAVPIAEICEQLQKAQVLPVLLRLP